MAHPSYEKAVAEYSEIAHIQGWAAGGDVHAAALCLAPQSPEGVPSAFNHDWISYIFF